MYSERKELFRQLEKNRKSKVLAYITGDRPGAETHIHPEVYDFFVNQLDSIGVVPKISFYLYTRGGNTLTAWSLANLLNMFCDELECIIPSKAHSAGTLICLGAKKLIMTKQATLSPIDPSIQGPLNPHIPGASPDAKAPVSVEAIKGFLDLCIEHLGDKKPESLQSVFNKLSENIHPLVLGQAFRTTTQIRMLADRLITGQIKDKENIKRIISFLCSESGSHDYMIHRREARDFLGLNIEKPNDELYSIIKKIYDDVQGELDLTSRFNPHTILGTLDSKNYSMKRALLESIEGGSDFFISEGLLSRHQIQTPQGMQEAIRDQRKFEGWRHLDE